MDIISLPISEHCITARLISDFLIFGRGFLNRPAVANINALFYVFNNRTFIGIYSLITYTKKLELNAEQNKNSEEKNVS